MAKLRRYDVPPGGVIYEFMCPGCNYHHPYRTKAYEGEKHWSGKAETPVPVWQFNGDLEKPSFTPSLLIHGHVPKGKTKSEGRCHLYVTDGKINYCGDCDHALAGKTVPMVELES